MNSSKKRKLSEKKKQLIKETLFRNIDTNNEGFIIGATLIDKMTSMSKDLELIVKLQSLLNYVEKDMKNSIITEDVLKSLISQFAII